MVHTVFTLSAAKLAFDPCTPQLMYIGTCGIEQRLESVILMSILGLSAIVEHPQYIDWTDVISTRKSMVRGTYFLLHLLFLVTWTVPDVLFLVALVVLLLLLSAFA